MTRTGQPTQSPSFSHRLNLYALAATAGVGLLAVPGAEAEVVYTPAHIAIPDGGYYLDLNLDGVNDFNLNINGSSRGRSDSGFFSIRPIATQNRIWGHGEISFGAFPRIAAFPLPEGFQVGPGNVGQQPEGSKLLAGYYRLATTGGFSAKGLRGDWANRETTAYLGLAFQIGSEIHYGWARLTVVVSPTLAFHALLTGYAYETVAGKAIKAGQTSDSDTKQSPDASIMQQPHVTQGTQLASLGALALGSSGLQLWRRE
jgi:hypothetical protein